MVASPRISVVLPACEVEHYIDDAIRSVREQTLRDFELIVVENGSKDGTAARAAAHAVEDPRVRVVHRDEASIVSALNDGVSQARAPLIARMDADDIALPTRLETQLRYMDEHPECALVGTWVRIVDPFRVPLYPVRRPTTHAALTNALIDGDGLAIIHPTACFRRSWFDQVGGYRREYESVEDIDLFLRLGRVGELHNIPEVLLDYRQHLESVNSKSNGSQSALLKRLFAELRLSPSGLAGGAQLRPGHGLKLLLWASNALMRGRRKAARRHLFSIFSALKTGDAHSLQFWTVRRG